MIKTEGFTEAEFSELSAKIYATMRNSSLFKSRKLEGKFVLNELIYILETAEYDYGLKFTINTEDGMLVPVEANMPVFIPTSTRAKTVEIVSIERSEVYGVSDRVLVVVKEV